MSKTTLGLFLLMAALSLAQDKSGPGSFGDHLGPEAPSAVSVPIDWAEQAVIAARHMPSAGWRLQHPDWRIVFDPRTDAPWRAFGPGIPVARDGASRDEIVTASGALVEQLAPAAGLDPRSFAFVAATRAGRLWYVDLAQIVSGAPVWNGGLTLRIDDRGRLVMWGGRFVDPAPVASAPALSSDQAVGATFAHLGRLRFLDTGTRIEPPATRLFVHVEDGRDRIVPRLAWLVELKTDAPVAWWKVFVDATDGAVLQYWNDVREHGHDGHEDTGEGDGLVLHAVLDGPIFMAPALAMFSGVSTGTVHDGVLPQSAPVLRNLSDLYVNCNGTNVVTDALGAYAFNGGPASVPVTSGLDGIHVTTSNTISPQALFSGTGTTGTLDVVWDDTNSHQAERDAFFFVNRAWNTLKQRNPAETLFGAALPAYVNIGGTSPQVCNAYYDGSSINFYAAGGGCINSAYSGSVVVHEYGHHVSFTIYASHGKSIPGDLGEGYSDCQSAAVFDTNLVGEGFSGPGSLIRNLDNACQYPASCGTEVHAAGLVIGGAFWHSRVQFANAYGAAGKVMMDEYLYQHLHGTPLDEAESCLEFLLLNDDDADLANGTPDAGKLYQGFTTQHSVPFPIPVMEVTHAPIKSTMDQIQDYQVHATAVPLLGGSMSSAIANYSINGGPYVGLVMTSTGGSQYATAIPVQPVGTTIRYFLQFQDSSGRTQTAPQAGALAPFTFRTFKRTPFFFDGFEASSGWTSATQAGANDWHNQAPGNPAHSWDPATAFDGTKCWGNDLSPASNWNGNYPNNVFNHLTSPPIDCTGRTGVSIVYRRWLTVEDGLYDHARIRVSNNGGASFTTMWENAAGSGSQHHVDSGWVEHAVDIAAIADNQPNVRVRFEMQSDAGLTFGGWNIDAFSLSSTTMALPLSQIGASTPFAVTTIRMAGSPGDAVILAVDLATQATYYDGVGTLSLSLFSPSFLPIFDGTIAIPPAGALDLTFVVPPASGLAIHFQGVLVPAVWSDLLVTNVLPFTIP